MKAVKKHADRQAGREADIQTDRQTGRQADIQTHTHTYMHSAHCSNYTGH